MDFAEWGLFRIFIAWSPESTQRNGCHTSMSLSMTIYFPTLFWLNIYQIFSRSVSAPSPKRVSTNCTKYSQKYIKLVCIMQIHIHRIWWFRKGQTECSGLISIGPDILIRLNHSSSAAVAGRGRRIERLFRWCSFTEWINRHLIVSGLMIWIRQQIMRKARFIARGNVITSKFKSLSDWRCFVGCIETGALVYRLKTLRTANQAADNSLGFSNPADINGVAE